MIPRLLYYAMRAGLAPAWRLSHANGAPYLDRTVLWGADCLENHSPAAPSHAFVHQIHAADGDRHMHDHPWVWAVAVVLSGGYTENRHYGTWSANGCEPVPTRCEYREGDVNILRPGDYHSIVSVLPDTSTLFLCGREASDWGFLVDGVHVPHAEYFKRPDVQRMTHARIR